MSSSAAAGKSLVKRYKLHQLAATSSQDLQAELAKDKSCDVNVRDRYEGERRADAAGNALQQCDTS